MDEFLGRGAGPQVDGRRQRFAYGVLTSTFVILWGWNIILIITGVTSSAKQTATLSPQSSEQEIISAVLIAAPLMLIGISLLRRPVPMALILAALTGGVLAALASFSYAYWQIGTMANFNIQLTHFDSWYIALGMFTANGTGNIVATSSAPGRSRTTMIFDMAIVVFVAGILVARFSEGSSLPPKNRVASSPY